jgi:hypothetical protein
MIRERVLYRGKPRGLVNKALYIDEDIANIVITGG